MAKSTHSQEVLTGTSDSFTEHEITDPNPPYQVQRAMLGDLIVREGDEELVGMDSLESSLSKPQSSEHSKANHQEPALTTESLSGQTETAQEGSSARSTGGVGRATVRPQLGKKTPSKTATRGKANVRHTGDDEDEFSEFE